MTKHVNWLFGRGASIACNLGWVVPEEFKALPREERIVEIKRSLSEEMAAESVDIRPYLQLIAMLEKQTADGWAHRFVTTNWDFLLQRTLLELEYKVCPQWLTNSHVFHLNGTIEQLPDDSQRSHFVLETDEGDARIPSHELDSAVAQMSWDCLFIVVGMSFECEGDKFLLRWLHSVEDDLPIGESTWLVLNPDQDTLDASCGRIKSALPRANILGATETLGNWLETCMPELVKLGVFSELTQSNATQIER